MDTKRLRNSSIRNQRRSCSQRQTCRHISGAIELKEAVEEEVKNLKISWGFVAGFFDADGSVWYYKDRDIYYLCFTNTNKEVLSHIQKFIRAGNIYVGARYKGHYGKKVVYFLGIRRYRSFMRVAKHLIGYVVVKRQKLKKAITFMENRKCVESRLSDDEAFLKYKNWIGEKIA